MVRFKMVGRDVDSAPLQFRTWIVDDTPDLDQSRFTGYKSGPHPLVDVNAHIIYDNTVVADFNQPLPQKWKSTYNTTPQSLPYSHLAVIDGYVYLFGGEITDKIFRAPVERPAEFVDTGAVLPTPLYAGQLAIIDTNVYIFGGNNGEATDTIFSAPLSDPLNWTNHGSLLPETVYASQLCIIDGYIYLFGGAQHFSHATGNIFKASSADPLTWSDTGRDLPFPLYNSQVGLVDGYVYLFGGQKFVDTPVDNILRADASDPLTWIDFAYLPYASTSAQFFTVGNNGYLITAISPGRQAIPSNVVINNGEARILRCSLSSPHGWLDILDTVPGEVTCSNLAIIYDRIFLYGGSGSSVIFATEYRISYLFNNPSVVAYGNITRTQYYNEPNNLDLFRVICFPPWKTDYVNNGTFIAPTP
jgi:hypothetical protein